MGEITGIEWTDKTWNPWHGCHKVSPGCKNCYMFRDKKRYGQDPNVVVRSKTKFQDPLKWPKEPAMCFTCSWSDWLIEEADTWRHAAYDVIAQTPWITYQILTKRIERAAGRVPNPPLPNVWLGVSVENQQTADERIPLLLQTPAAVRFVSYEPALGSLDLFGIKGISESLNTLNALTGWYTGDYECRIPLEYRGLDWIIAGGESGPGARSAHPDWFRSVRDQCQAAGVPFFFKQWGEWVSVSEVGGKGRHFSFPDRATVRRVGKLAAGAVLDGREWREFPSTSQNCGPDASSTTQTKGLSS